MRIDIDLDTNTWVYKSEVDFKRDTSEELVIRFFRAGAQTALVANTVGKFSIKPRGQYDAEPLVAATSWTYYSDGSDPRYIMTPGFAGEALAALLNHGDDDETNDEDYILCIAEIFWETPAGQKSRTQTVNARIWNDVVKDADASPDQLPGPNDTWVAHAHPQSLSPDQQLQAQQNIGLPKNNLVATVAPTVSDDSTQGYARNSKWFDTVASEVYYCINPAVGAAVWAKATLTPDELGNAAFRNVGTSAGEVTAGDDSRLNDARTPVAHAASHATGGSDEITPANIGAESPAGAQAKADAVVTAHEADANAHAALFAAKQNRLAGETTTTSAPSSGTHNLSSGYQLGHKWTNTDTGEIYWCVQSAETFALWELEVPNVTGFRNVYSNWLGKMIRKRINHTPPSFQAHMLTGPIPFTQRSDVQAGDVRIVGVGNSFTTWPEKQFRRVFGYLQGVSGHGGYSNIYTPQSGFSGGASVIGAAGGGVQKTQTLTPSAGGYLNLPDGGSCFGGGNDMGNTLWVGYVQEPGAGTLVIETRYSNASGGAWTERASIDCNGSLAYLNWKSTGLRKGGFEWRVRATGGTVRVAYVGKLGCLTYMDSRTGSSSGGGYIQWTDEKLDAGTIESWWAAYDPHIVFVCYSDTYDADGEFERMYERISAAAPNAQIIVIGEHHHIFGAYYGDGVSWVNKANDAIRSYVRGKANITFLELSEAMPDGHDGMWPIGVMGAFPNGVQHNVSATRDPLATDDSNSGYAVGSFWRRSDTLTYKVCTSAAVGAATWVDDDWLHLNDVGDYLANEIVWQLLSPLVVPPNRAPNIWIPTKEYVRQRYLETRQQVLTVDKVVLNDSNVYTSANNVFSLAFPEHPYGAWYRLEMLLRIRSEAGPGARIYLYTGASTVQLTDNLLAWGEVWNGSTYTFKAPPTGFTADITNFASGSISEVIYRSDQTFRPNANVVGGYTGFMTDRISALDVRICQRVANATYPVTIHAGSMARLTKVNTGSVGEHDDTVPNALNLT